MRVLFVNYRYYLSGGPESYLFRAKELLEQHGHLVFVFSVQDPRNLPCEQSAYFVQPRGGDGKFRTIRLAPASIIRLLKGAFYNPEAARNLKRLIADVRPDVVYVLQ